MASDSRPLLYSFYRSSCSWRVRLALSIKGIAYDTKSINLLTEENKTKEYKQIQPFGAIPAFVDDINEDNTPLIESAAIIEYLDETRPENPLLPKDPRERAIVRSLVYAIAMGIQPICSIRVLKFIGKDNEEEWTKHFMSEGFAAFEKLLQRTAGKYAFGDTITMADLFLVPQFFNGLRFGVDMTAYPIMSRINSTLEQLEAFKAAHPTRQPDCPPELRQ
ncbi:glutathione S-transferase [Lobosporangium transversale]|uniref:Glutathione S-transferase n=1 Tax=Lobosporangium transversale TaxID=64571 RepID=A0A1Y2GCV2_9FUNG|nr:glutathione S-transferase [Lobosporangium transversale]ORZ07262.1 glutathione S-transferase [Lobosporangium transversale]|eukprot:XP_021877925.1 glutathione S-transferase [Lobosporangium transversale]